MYKNKIKMLQQKNRRLAKKNESLKNIIQNLKPLFLAAKKCPKEIKLKQLPE